MSAKNGLAAPTAAPSELLECWRGSFARIWEYAPTLSTLTIRLESRQSQGNLHVVCGGTRHISGPSQWSDCNLEIGEVTEDGERLQILRDRAAGFELRCEVLGLRQDVEPIYERQGAAATMS